MKTIYVKTSKVVSHDNYGDAVYETRVQKLSERDAFNYFLKFYKSENYKTSEIVGVYDSKTKELHKEGDLVDEYKKLLLEAKVVEEVKDPKEEVKELKAMNEVLMKRLEALELGNDKPTRGRPKTQEV